MNIEAKGFKLDMTHDELWNLYFWVESSLIYTIKTHWVNHQDKWKENEAERLKTLEAMSSNLGRIDLYNNCIYKVNEAFKDFNEKKN